MQALLAVSEQDRDDAVAIWVPYQIFDKADREGDIPQGKLPFRFCGQPNMSSWHIRFQNCSGASNFCDPIDEPSLFSA